MAIANEYLGMKCKENCPFYVITRPSGTRRRHGRNQSSAECQVPHYSNEPTHKGKPCLHPEVLKPRINTDFDLEKVL